MERTYAQALWGLVQNGMEPKEAVHAMYALLQKEGRTEIMPRVARAFERLAERQLRKQNYTLTVARESDIAHAKREIKAFTGQFGVDAGIFEHGLKTQVDDSLIGGWRLEGNERLVDASYKQRLLDVFNNVTRA